MRVLILKNTLPILAAVFFAAACNSGTDTNRSNTGTATTPPGQAGNEEPGSRRDTTTASGTTYQGSNTNTSNSASSSSSAQSSTPQNQQNQNGNRTNMQNQNNTTSNHSSPSNNIAAIDRNFAKEAYIGGRKELKMANMAMERAQDTRIKDFAQMMVRDHTKANNELETILSKEGLMTEVENETENSNDSHMKDMMSNKTGNDFDVSFMRMMVNDHNKTIDLFRKESIDGKDDELKAFATKTLPVLKTHLDSAKAIYGSLGGATSTRH